ncbi:hypothetical protein B0H14DRAFT_2349626 [Mycena olivaceomarginata]|nr:hypothetical protein B0H14DRAFT_2349626 [Mycena olivaceomarginata]
METSSRNHPFWEDLPCVNIYLSITPDVLHQLYQGVIKHVVLFLSAQAEDIDVEVGAV